MCARDKRIGPYTYVYLVENVREEGRTKQRIIANLGCRARRLEPLQLALASSDCLMRILRSVIFPKPLLMPTAQSETSEGGAVGAQLVADQQFRHETLLPEKLAH